MVFRYAGDTPLTAVGLITMNPLVTCSARRYVLSHEFASYELILLFIAISTSLMYSSHYLQAKNARRKDGKTSGMLGCMGRCCSRAYCSTTSLTRGTYDFNVKAVQLLIERLQPVDVGVQRGEAKDGGARREDRLSLICVCIHDVSPVAFTRAMRPNLIIIVYYA